MSTLSTSSSPDEDNHSQQMISIPRPHVPYGPEGVSEAEADAHYLREAARKLEYHYKPFGSNVRATVVKLLNDAAESIAEAEENEIMNAFNKPKQVASVDDVNHVITEGQSSREQMMEELLMYSYSHGYIHEGSYDAYAQGSWDKIREAYINELLTDEEYDRLKDHHYGDK